MILYIVALHIKKTIKITILFSLSLSLIFIPNINAQTIRVLNNLEAASLNVDSPILEYYDNKVDGHSSIT